MAIGEFAFANNSNRAINPPAGFTENFDTPVTGLTLTLTSEGSEVLIAHATGTYALAKPASR